MNKKLIFIAIFLVIIGIIGFRLVTHNTNPIDTTRAVSTDNLHYVILKIDGMYCVSCLYNVENVLKDTYGVVNVTVGFIKKEIVNGIVEGRGEVIYDVTKTNPDKILQAILPYRGTVLNDEKTNSTQLNSHRFPKISFFNILFARKLAV